MKKLLSLFPVLFVFTGQAQDYTVYQSILNRTDTDVLQKNYHQAIKRLDTVYNQYPFIYARHCIKALQICVSAGDSVHADQWLKKCFIQGVPLWIIQTNKASAPSLLFKNCASALEQYEQLHAAYEQNIDQKLASTIDSLYTIDQKRTRNVNEAFFLFRLTIHALRWKKNNTKQFAIIDKMIDDYGFPGERLIGLPTSYTDSALYKKNMAFYGPYLQNHSVYIMLIHYFSNPRKDINAKLMENVKKGNLPPEHYAALNDFMARWGKGKYGNHVFYNAWHKDNDTTHLPAINERRRSIGLNTFEEQEKNNLIRKERRKNKSANTEIILE